MLSLNHHRKRITNPTSFPRRRGRESIKFTAKTSGFSIVELMVAVTIGLILLASVTSSFNSTTSATKEELQQTRLNLAIYTALNHMRSEISRAGSYNASTVNGWETDYQVNVNTAGNLISPGEPGKFPVVTTSDIGPLIAPAPAPSGCTAKYSTGLARITEYDGSGASASGEVLESFDGDPPPSVQMDPSVVCGDPTPEDEHWVWVNPFAYASDSTNKLQIVDDQATGSCILFTYDKDNDGVINTSTSDNDRFGFRLADNSGVGSIQERKGGTTFTCTPDGNNTWQAITDEDEIDVTNLQFSDSETTFVANSNIVGMHLITITMTATLVDDSSVTDTKSETFMVRNYSFNG